jgi:hypothetical protein
VRFLDPFFSGDVSSRAPSGGQPEFLFGRQKPRFANRPEDIFCDRFRRAGLKSSVFCGI